MENNELLGLSELNEKEISIEFDKVVDIYGKEYNNVFLTTSINNWINGFKDKEVKTSAVIDGVTKEVKILYSDNVKNTNKIMAECEIAILSDFNMIPTLDCRNFQLISDKVNLNYDTEIHPFLYDFRYITYN